MSSRKYFDLNLMILNHQVVDSEGKNCGKVDDVALNDRAEFESLLIGVNNWSLNLPQWLVNLWSRFEGYKNKKIPWSEVDQVSINIKLKKKAEDYGLNTVETKLTKIFSKIPQL